MSLDLRIPRSDLNVKRTPKQLVMSERALKEVLRSRLQIHVGGASGGFCTGGCQAGDDGKSGIEPLTMPRSARAAA